MRYHRQFTAILISLAGIHSLTASIIFDTTSGVTEYSSVVSAVGIEVKSYVPSYGAYGMAFTVPSGQYSLDGVYLPLFRESGSQHLTLALMSESSALAGSLPESMIATIADSSFQWPEFAAETRFGTYIPVTSNTLLQGGSRYWIVAYPNTDGEDSLFKWMVAPNATYPRLTDSAWDYNPSGLSPTGQWTNSGSIPDLALAVYASPIPEANTAILLLLGLAGIVIWIRKYQGYCHSETATNKYAEQTDALNSHAFGTFGTSPAEQALVPKASGSK